MSTRQPRRTAATPTLPPTPLLTIRVQGKPISVNRMYGSTRTGRKYVTQEARAWQGAVWVAAYQAWAGVGRKRYPLILPIDGTYRVVCTFYRIRRNADADNLLKLTLDGLKTGIHIDDRHFTTVEAHLSPDKSQPQGAYIEVYTAA